MLTSYFDMYILFQKNMSYITVFAAFGHANDNFALSTDAFETDAKVSVSRHAYAPFMSCETDPTLMRHTVIQLY